MWSLPRNCCYYNDAMVHLNDGDTYFFDMVAGILQGYILVLYNLPWLRTSNDNIFIKIKWFLTKKADDIILRNKK